MWEEHLAFPEERSMCKPIYLAKTTTQDEKHVSSYQMLPFSRCIF